MTKRLIDIDDDLLREAKRVLHEDTMRATVNAALGEVVNAELRRRHVDRLVSGEGTDLADATVMDGAWR